MALKIRTVMTYPLTGAVDFAITFEYLARKFVTVTLIGKDRKELVLNQDYRFTTKTQITTTRTWTAADGYDSIEIRRYTSATDRLVDFADGSILRAYDLNIAQIQTLHVAEEARDLTADTIGVNNDGHLDARGRRIVNVANPVDDGDAVNLRSLKVWNDSALNSANRAKQEADRANTEAVSSWQARNASEQFRNEAGEHRRVAESAKDQAISARDVAVSARDTAGTYRTEAASSANKSETARDKAQQWAENNPDAPVVQGHFSAKHWQHYSKVEADRAKREADRADVEASKLGNMNNLAANIENASTDPNIVIFKGQVVSRGNLMAATNLREEPSVGSWWGTQSLMSAVEVNGRKRMLTQLYSEGTAGADDRKTTLVTHEYDANESIGRSSYAHLLHNESRWWSRQHGALGYQTGWDDPTSSRRAPYWIDDVANNDGGWVPALSVHTRATGGYPVRATQGLISRGPSAWADYGFRLRGDGLNASTFFLTMGANIQCWTTGYDGVQANFEFAKNPVSDIRLKDITGKVDESKCLNNIERMNFVEFTFKRDANKQVRRGVIAQEVQKIDPQYTSLSVMEATNETPRVETLQLDLTPMTLDALAAIKELSSQVKELKAELKQLKEAK